MRTNLPCINKPLPIIRGILSFHFKQIFYADNATVISAETALATAWIGPSITPLTNMNSGFVRVFPL